MLDQETKRKIDNARDILVGKVPDPKSQVEQITIALIYKFMDDMDKESEEWGGKSTFFTGDYGKYAWSKIFDPRLGGFDLIKLYGDAIVKMNQNPNIPQLFRDIFKNAYLPYRDPETLKSFLKEINEFTYDHSERLGDAFEYLLSVMDSQGEAGQFRTPRHIIDFIVEIVKPKKNETVLDPACGTAGFLISSYKHILKTNTKDRKGDQLTPDERKRLMNNFTGYDISPDMVRLSLVNLYLHGFSDPKIVEYDTLTSEERWNETADVVLANPPFMTPKGGIRPHKRFSVQAKRSEVLFVDYIAEHLNPGGRAGVIVPEGIIFQSSNAYKDLRKMLVEDYLWAVVSLPAGVFQPYSGVKTSILLMDNTLSKKTDKILFVKVENDGFDLGAQRRPIDKNDLPEALRILQSGDADGSGLAHFVKKSKIVESGDWNLSGERYKDRLMTQTDYELVELSELCDIQNGYAFKSKDYVEKSNTLNFRMSNIRPDGRVDIDYSPKYLPDEYADTFENFRLEDGDVVIAMTDMASEPKILGVPTIVRKDERNLVLNQRVGKFDSIDTDRIFIPYLKHILNTQSVRDYYKTLGGGGLQINIGKKDILRIKIPLPPLSVQEEIVAEIDGYQKIIDGARQVVDNYKPTIKIDPDWEMVSLGDIALIISGQSPQGKYYNKKGKGLPFYQGKTEFGDIYIGSPKKWTTQVTKEANKGDILLSVRAPVGPVNFATQHCCIGRGLAAIRVNEKVEKVYLYNYLKSVEDRISGSGGSVFDSINRKMISAIKIPLPPLSVQQEIVTKIEAEQEMVNANKKLVDIYEQKIRDKISEVWEE